MSVKRRFIAGAKCPKCEAMDRIVMLTSGDAEWIECIECNYSENRPTFVDDPQMPEVADEIGVIQFKPRSRS
jgi:uncharacterized protein